MAEFITIASSSSDVDNYFADKRTEIPVAHLRTIGEEGDFCACLAQCIPCLKVFTDEEGDDFYKNDKYLIFDNNVPRATVKVYLTKIDQEGNETDYEITDDTYGDYTDGTSNTPEYVSFEADFYLIWLALGYGKYKFRIESINVASKVVQTTTSPCFELQKYSDRLANGTIRIETTQYGEILSGNNYGSEAETSSDTTFNQQIRLPGSLKFTGNTVETDYLQLNGNKRNLLQIKDQLSPTYDLKLELLGAKQSFLTIFDYLFANEVKISDYNVYNFVIDPENPSADYYRSVPVYRVDEEIDPSGMRRRRSFTIKLEYGYKNVFKTNN